MKLLNQLKDLQVFLTTFGFYKGPIDGRFGKNSVIGLRSFTEGTEITIEKDTLLNNSNKEVIEYLDCRIPYCDDKSSLSFLDKINYLSTNSFEINGLEPKYGNCWSKKVSDEFVIKIRNWVNKNNMNPNTVDWVMAIINFESGGTFSPKIQNSAGAKAFGLIQFMGPAAKDLGTTLDELVKMTDLEQLDYVFKYFERWNIKRLTRLEDFYFSVLYPKAIGWDLDAAVFVEGSIQYKQNKGLDLNKDGVITVSEINSIIYNSYYNGMCYLNRNQLKG